jgi:hypothetical protein
MTSANVIEYTIYKDGEEIDRFRKHLMTIYPLYSDLLKYQPLNEHQILAWGYGEDEDYWEDDEPENLETFLRRIREKDLIQYFKDNDRK